jgi:hypothetical protein
MWAAGVGTIATAISTALIDDVFSVDDLTQIVTAVIGVGATMFAVWKTSNGPKVTP